MARNEFPQFATCIEDGLNIHAYDKTNAAGITSKSSDLPAAEKSSASSKTGNCSEANQQPAGEGSAKDDSITNMGFSRVECTNGALEGLRLCHSAFLSAIASSLADLEASSDDDDDGTVAAASKKRKSSSTAIKTLAEHDVMTCMEKIGLSSLAERAMAETLKKKKRRKKDPFANLKGSREDLIAEQERLLLESARRVQTMNEAEGKEK
eukprot:CAMPEP_0181089874 /NCGR_PEP_ID=MMETSP1071-20121207/7534_1 /TAXON_ID=35127 /ORGANISM="Thalassiosira sp., Strain NH16" /LENGTH=208 /DNA_ID=CAMNT_0023171849 /DNA_START=157 /DNA_END=783 /DNA_ORIENTATION=+